jgi:hypothetical protein
MSQIAHDLGRLGIPVPTQLAAAQAAATKFLASVPDDSGNPVGAALDALERGDDPFGDEVQRQLAMYRLAELNLPNQARLRAEGKLSDTLASNADAVLSALAERLQGPAEAMAAAHQAGVRDLTDPRTLRGPALACWGEAASSVDLFAVARQVVTVLFRDMHRAAPDPLRTLAAAAPGQLVAARDLMARDNRLPASWALASTDIPIAHAASLDELQRRDNHGVDGVVQPLEPDDQPASKKPRTNATVSA